MKSKRKPKSSLLSRSNSLRPGIAIAVLGVAIAGGGVYLSADATNMTTVTACKPYSVSDINAATPAVNEVAYKFISQGQAKHSLAWVKAGASCVNFQLSLVSY